MAYNRLQLPDRDADLYAWARRSRALFDRGPRAAFMHASSRQRFEGNGELAGQSGIGRLRDIRISRSVLRGESVYRYREISPERHVLVLVDLRDLGNFEDGSRLLSTGVAISVLVSAIADTQLTWGAFGSDRLVPSVSVEGARPARLLRGSANALLNLKRDPFGRSVRKQEGVIRRALATSPDAHVILVSHYIEKELLNRLPFIYGATIFLVEGASDGLLNPRGAMTIGSFLPPGLTGEMNLGAYSIRDALQSRRCACVFVAASGSVLNAISAALMLK